MPMNCFKTESWKRLEMPFRRPSATISVQGIRLRNGEMGESSLFLRTRSKIDFQIH